MGEGNNLSPYERKDMSKYLKLLNSDTGSMRVGASLDDETIIVVISGQSYAIVQEKVGKAIQVNNPSLEVVEASKGEYLDYRALKEKEEKDAKKAKEKAEEKAKEEAKEDAKKEKENEKRRVKLAEKAEKRQEKELQDLKDAEEQVLREEEAKKETERLAKQADMVKTLAPIVALAVKELLPKLLEEQKVGKKESKPEGKSSKKS